MTARRNWLAIGTGIGVEIAGESLHAVVTRVRPSGTEVLGSLVIRDYRSRPAADWGNEYAAFLRGLGVSHLAAAVVLPRRGLKLRVVSLPAVSGGELEAA